MIIRKPYAFFIKNFRKIHIVLLIFALIILFMQGNVSSFIKEFVQLKTYDPNNFPITKYIPIYLLIIVALSLIASLIITIILKRKEKPWKLYLIPNITLALILFIDFIVRAYFLSYTGKETIMEVTVYRDILIFTNVMLIPTIIIFAMRVLGLDLKKFNFNTDEEYLELEESDQEEIEININVDKEAFRRIFNRTKREVGYFYKEHKKICILLILIISIFVIRTAYVNLIVQTKKYHQNEEYNIDGYTFVVKDVYYTDKSNTGVKISPNKSFVVVDMSVKNNAEPRKLNLGNFHMLNGITNYTDSEATYEKEFEDLGKIYDKQEISRDKTINFIIIFKVDNNLDLKRFVLGYQEKGSNPYLRKIKLDAKDISKIEKENKSIGDTIIVKNNGQSEKISVDEVNNVEYLKYRYQDCDIESNCDILSGILQATPDKKLMVIEYGTEELESKELIDFSSKYGKIIYIDSNDNRHEIEMKNPLNITYLGKYTYSYVPKDIETAKKTYLEYTIRNKKYVYKIEQ